MRGEEMERRWMKMENTGRSTLSEMASAIWRLRRREAMVAEEMDAFGAPSECAADAYDGLRLDEAVAFKVRGWTPEVYDAELAARTSKRFAYFSGLGARMDDMEFWAVFAGYATGAARVARKLELAKGVA